MIVYTLNEDTKKRLEDLIQFTTKHHKLWTQYCKLKNEGKNNDSEFESQKTIIDIEDKIYQNDFDTLNKIRAAITYLKRKYTKSSILSLTDVLSGDSETLAVKRIISKLYKENFETQKEYYSRVPQVNSYSNEEDRGNIILLDREYEKNSKLNGGKCFTYKEYLAYNEMYDWFEKSSVYIFLNNIEKLINSSESDPVKESIRTAQNNTCFLNEWLDDNFIYNNSLTLEPNLNNLPLLDSENLNFQSERYSYGYKNCNKFLERTIDLAYISNKLSEFLLMRTYIETYASFINDMYTIEMLKKRADYYINECNYKNYIFPNDDRIMRVLTILEALDNSQRVKR